MFYLNLTANGDDRFENLRERGRQQANDGPRARFRLRPGFVIQVSLEHSLSRSLLRSPSFFTPKRQSWVAYNRDGVLGLQTPTRLSSALLRLPPLDMGR